MTQSTNFDVVIVGAGIAGIATAYYLTTQQNVTNILLVDKRPPMTFTSDKSGSNYRNWWSHPAMIQLANHSIDLMDLIARDKGNFFNMNRRGYAYFSQNSDLESYLKSCSAPALGEIRLHDSLQNSYIPTENSELIGADVIIGNHLVKHYAPFVSDDIGSMVHVRRAGWISTRVLAHHMLDTATQAGLVEMRGEVTHIEHKDAQSTLHIKTGHDDQTITTSKLVITVGPNLSQFSDMLNLDSRTYNVHHQKVMIRDDKQVIPDDMPFMIYRDSPTADWTDEELKYLERHAQSVYMPGNFHIRRINDKWIHIGWAFNQLRTRQLDDNSLDEMFPKVALKGLSSFIPALKPFAESLPQPIMVSGGFYTRTPENLPIIQALSLTGIYVIGALSGFGVMMGCGAGELLSRIIAEQELPSYAQHFSLTRYDDPDYDESIHAYTSGEL